ncbi:MAG: deoxyribonuclease IV [Candidatus Omnitrophota bacterium]|nr:deoxyribonuclease IV [Candidatus Omnitrophota bacterium]
MILGIHISGVDKIIEAPAYVAKLGCNTMQMFLRSPQKWRANFLEPKDIEEFKAKQKAFRIKPVFIHIPYCLNLASSNPRLYNASIKAYIEDISEAALLGADYLVTHMGSHKETSEKEGIKRLSEALNRILKETRSNKTGILLENTSGSGSWLGYKFIHHREIIKDIEQKERIGLCFDTAHAYLAGYDISGEKGLEAVLDEIDKMVGLNLIKLIHLNDAKGKLGSHHDRHEHIGEGSIGLEGMRRIINHPKLRAIPFILETPKDSKTADKENLGMVRKLRNQKYEISI